ncbi:hypothetical protein O181_129560 [Austropuccinia psidii MF-1]|uniref:Uncharacterized protein n=1 Tax=Austropuccinia psidii MF-1 TaxID=1389203 RepID=A0A9Q3KXC9_9BASI|nr:hypothetical protein [Austropuccinia psidii MF-1]
MDYKPFTNDFNDLPIKHQVLAKNDAECFAFAARAHTPIQGVNNTGGGESDRDQEANEPLVSIYQQKSKSQSRLHQSMLRNMNQVTNTDVKNSNSSNDDDLKTSSSPDGFALFLHKEKEKSGNPPASEMKSDTARQNTLAALNGRVNPDEEPKDDDVPLGVTRAAHTRMSGIKAIQTKKKQKETSVERDQLKPTAPDGESLQDSQAKDDDNDDVPLGIQSQLNLRQ